MEISLSILNMNFNNLGQALNEIENEIDYLHLDVMDGSFVPNISFGPAIIKDIHNNHRFILDTHLMINNPMKYIKSFVDAGSNYITFHYEAIDNVKEAIDFIHSFNVKAGISIKPNTDVAVLKPYLADIDLVLIMSVEPGFGGQSFMPTAIDKVKYLKELKVENDYSYLISIDGGISDKTINYVSRYLDLAVVGSYITAASYPLENVKKLKNISK